MKKNIIFDVMLRDRFVCTMVVPLTFDIVRGYDDGTPIIDIEALGKYIIKKRPTLTNEPFTICIDQ